MLSKIYMPLKCQSAISSIQELKLEIKKNNRHTAISGSEFNFLTKSFSPDTDCDCETNSTLFHTNYVITG